MSGKIFGSGVVEAVFYLYSMNLGNICAKRVVQGNLCHGSWAEKLTNHESRIFKFCFEALHVSREICASWITKNIFFKSREPNLGCHYSGG